MKKSIKIIILVFGLSSFLESKAQASLDIFGVIPVHKCGWGFGGKIFTPALSFGNIDIKLGGGIYGSSLVKRIIRDVPLDAPQTGNATVNFKNDVLGFDGILRFSLPYSSPIVPYFDVFAGSRLFAANMNITPNGQSSNNQNSTFKNMSSISQFNYGGEFGLMFSFSDSFKFNTGIMYTYSPDNGEVVDVNKIHLEAGTLIADKMATPHGMFIAKVGFVFVFNGSGNASVGGTSGGARRSGGFRLGGSTGGAKIGGGGINKVRLNIKPKT